MSHRCAEPKRATAVFDTNLRGALRLNRPRRTTRPVPRRVRQPFTAPPVLNQTWALGFMTEMLYDGRRIRLFTIIDEGNREDKG